MVLHVMLKHVQGDKKAGFTLAEVLFVITIIGVVASLTIPDLVTNVQESQYKVAWKKSFSQLSQATNMIMNDNDGTMLNITTNNGVDSQLGFATIYSRYLNYLKICNTWGCSDIPWHQAFNWFDLAGTPQDNAGFLNSGLILNDGSFLRINGWPNPNANNCTGNILGVQTCAEILIDTNGFKGPNVIGKDIFGAHLTKSGLEPWGMPPYQGIVPPGQYGDDAYRYSNCSATDIPPHSGTVRGKACGYQYLLQ